MKLESQNITAECLNVAKLAAHSAGKYLSDNFGEKHTAKFKSPSDIGLAVDIGSEEIILNIIKEKYPEHNFYSEEIGELKNNSKFTWYIDPLDGTNNYFAGIPYFSVSIALMCENEIILGVVYNPIANQLFEAVKDEGAYLNKKELQPSENFEMNKSVCSFIQGHNVPSSQELDTVKINLQNNFRRIISTWSPALDWALLAFGGIDALVSFDSELEDMYAGLLIAQEAGIVVSNFGENKIIASNKSIHKSLSKLF